jgi:demethylmenaquinone methyltransferase/2-methoxy-6-polyprenyl-1,4-benzoquinol methylase
VIDKQPVRIAGMFDAIAGAYDFLNHVLSAGSDRRWRRRAIRALNLGARETVLDLCAGTADFGLEALAASNLPSRVIGVDFSDGMLRRGLAKIRRRGLSRRFWLVRGNAIHLPVRSDSVDAVIVAFGLRNVEGLGEALAEIHRALAAGGRLAILEFAIPDAGPARALYLWYFTRVLPAVGRVVSGHASAYAYLPASVREFPPAAAMAALLTDHGFSEVTSDPLTGGIVYLYMGRKRSAEARTAALPGGSSPGCYNQLTI